MDQEVLPEEENQSRAVSTPNLEAAFSSLLPSPVSFVNTVVHESISLSASDILFEPRKRDLRLRTRIDGVLYELGKISLEAFEPISSRIKVLSGLDPTERRRIQEGQFTINHEGRMVNLRVEIAQTIYGELIVIRIHEKKTIVMDLSQLGLSKKAYQAYQEMLRQRSGLILVCGPTGCGKTTTLYSTISKLNEQQNYNVMTIEDPVEFQLEGVNQMQTREQIGFTFARGLRTILRLSPDIVFVGEIRDRETAKISVESALSGQLILSTVHAEDSIGTLFRMIDLGIETYLLNSVLVGVIAQRLVRRLCPFCRAPYQPSQDEIDLFNNLVGRPPKQLMRSRGCPQCQKLAYRGRVGIFEVLKLDSRVRSLIRSKINEDELRNILIKEGFISHLRDGLEKCEQGITAVEEILRNTLTII